MGRVDTENTHSEDLTVHGSFGNHSDRRRAGIRSQISEAVSRTTGTPDVSAMHPRLRLALRFVGCDATCLGAMLNGRLLKRRENCSVAAELCKTERTPVDQGFQMNSACILPRGKHSDPRGHWKALKRRPDCSDRVSLELPLCFFLT